MFFSLTELYQTYYSAYSYCSHPLYVKYEKTYLLLTRPSQPPLPPIHSSPPQQRPPTVFNTRSVISHTPRRKSSWRVSMHNDEQKISRNNTFPFPASPKHEFTTGAGLSSPYPFTILQKVVIASICSQFCNLCKYNKNLRQYVLPQVILRDAISMMSDGYCPKTIHTLCL